ncbi:MAG: ABC transporter permease [Candidatus Bathyarchaeota archaeon]|nr:ABC transporter permease [Candidatus Bathyarchaeota archaeon]
MGLKAYLLKRTLYSFALLFFVLILNFAIFELMPGDPMALFANAARLGGKEVAEEMIELWGFDEPMHIRLLTYIKNMLTFQFGTSYLRQTPIIEQVAARLTNTLLLVGVSSILAIIIGVLLGVLAAHKRGTKWDSLLVVTSLTTYSLPSFWMGMIFLLVFAYGLQWFPTGHTTSFSPLFPAPNIFVDVADRMWHLFLPVLTLTLFMYGSFLLLTRATMMETLTEDYVTTARAKGLKERAILFKHALKNASLPVITNAAISIGFILSGAIITEQVFKIPGLGQWTWEAIPYKDYPVLHCIFYLTALCVIIANFVADVLYGAVDPRIKYG